MAAEALRDLILREPAPRAQRTEPRRELFGEGASAVGLR